jgi:hypothetical protein
MTNPPIIKLPLQSLTQHIAVLGKTGSGKTFAVKGAVVEPLLEEGRRVGIIDPTGAWWGLRSSRDGKGPGFPILVLGGDHGDLPLPALGGGAVARLLAEQSVNLVADTTHLTVGERTRWFIDFATTLYRLNKSPLHLVLDEAHNFAPKGKIPDPDTGKMLHAANTLASGGRSRGIRLGLITQRPQKLHNDTLTSADTLIAMRVLAPHDRMAVEDWIKGCGDLAAGKEVLNSLATLQRGEGWVWYPEGGFLQRGRFPAIRTFDSSATPTDGHAIAAPKRAAEIDLAEIRTALADAVKEAEANDPKLLRQRIAQLEREMSAKKPAAHAVSGIDEAEVQRRIREAVAAIPASLPTASKALLAGVEKIAAGLQAVQAELAGVSPAIVPRARTVAREPLQREVSPAPATPQRVAEGVSQSEQRILDAIAWWRAAGVEHPTRHQAAFVAGYTVNGHFNNQCGALRGRGLIDYPGGGTLSLLPAGEVVANAPDAKPTRDDLVRHVTAVLKGEPMRRLFMALVDAAEPLQREELASRCGYTVNGHFNNLCGALTGIGVAEYPQKGYVGLTTIFKGLGNG